MLTPAELQMVIDPVDPLEFERALRAQSVDVVSKGASLGAQIVALVYDLRCCARGDGIESHAKDSWPGDAYARALTWLR